MMNTGIYCIEHKESGKKYVGSSTNIAKRWDGHRSLLRRNKHESPYLQAAWNKYGEEAFVFTVLLLCDKEELISYEQACLDGYKTANRDCGFNARLIASSNYGLKMSEAARAAKSARYHANGGCSLETRAKLSAVHKGKKKPSHVLEKLRASRIGSSHSLVTRLRLRDKAAVKLNAEKAEAIRQMYAEGTHTQAAIGFLFGVSRRMVSAIANNTRWAQIV